MVKCALKHYRYVTSHRLRPTVLVKDTIFADKDERSHSFKDRVTKRYSFN